MLSISGGDKKIISHLNKIFTLLILWPLQLQSNHPIEIAFRLDLIGLCMFFTAFIC